MKIKLYPFSTIDLFNEQKALKNEIIKLKKELFISNKKNIELLEKIKTLEIRNEFK